MDIADAIKEGDGFRLTSGRVMVFAYKLILLFAYKFRHIEYACALLLLLVQTGAVLSEEDSFCLIMTNRQKKTLNLHLEHLRRLPTVGSV